MKIKTTLILLAGLWLLVRNTRPKWYDDLMLRAYASDQFGDPGKTEVSKKAFEKASNTAAKLGLPLGWVLAIAKKVSPDQLMAAAEKVRDAVYKMGPPPDTFPKTLEAYKKKALEVVP